MSWREFQLRHKAYKRDEKLSLEKLRILAYQIFKSGISAPKKQMSMEQFWPLDGDQKTGLTESKISALKKAQEKVKWKI